MNDEKQIIINNLNKEIVERMDAGKEAEDKGNMMAARMEYESAKDVLDMIVNIGGECDMGELIMKKLEEVPEVSKDELMHDVDNNPLGKLVAGPYFYRSACCERMREAIRNQEMGLRFDCMDGEITIDMHPKYLRDVVERAMKTDDIEDVKLFYPEAFNEDGELDLDSYEYDEDMDYVSTDCCPFCGAKPERE